MSGEEELSPDLNGGESRVTRFETPVLGAGNTIVNGVVQSPLRAQGVRYEGVADGVTRVEGQGVEAAYELTMLPTVPNLTGEAGRPLGGLQALTAGAGSREGYGKYLAEFDTSYQLKFRVQMPDGTIREFDRIPSRNGGFVRIEEAISVGLGQRIEDAEDIARWMANRDERMGHVLAHYAELLAANPDVKWEDIQPSNGNRVRANALTTDTGVPL